MAERLESPAYTQWDIGLIPTKVWIIFSVGGEIKTISCTLCSTRERIDLPASLSCLLLLRLLSAALSSGTRAVHSSSKLRGNGMGNF